MYMSRLHTTGVGGQNTAEMIKAFVPTKNQVARSGVCTHTDKNDHLRESFIPRQNTNSAVLSF